MRQPKETFGYVMGSLNKVPIYQRACKIDDTVWVYPRVGTAEEAGKRKANTFFEWDWSKSTPEETNAALRRFQDQQKAIAEMDRLMPPVSSWSRDRGFNCRMCGNFIHSQSIHFKYHLANDIRSLAFAETVTFLFGSMSE